ncbi:glycosyltransferase family 4 protein [uncultured Psychroserpens sp.]|uniref:glycosyltransferase family 4 protein n=1 Tax=uncultured Psychroserpens sp. TaxID=255436 RepID=UPI0026257294|nr:glycosyltransferase family 4 protein [uncultured Psychroserpens sp.]
MLNIGFITNNHYPRMGGMEYCTHYLAKHLNAMDSIEASVACSTLRDIPQDFHYPYFCYRAKSFSFLTPWLFQKNRERMVKNQNVMLLHGQMLHGGGYEAMKLSKKFDLPFVAQSHGADVQKVPEINYGALNDNTQKNKIKEVLKSAHKLIAVSSINKQNMIDLGAEPDRIQVVHNGVDVKQINAIPFNDLRPQFGLKPDDFVLITVGRNKPVKRMELLFEALQKLKDYKSIKCLCVGPKHNLESLANRYNITDKIVLTGSIPEKYNFSNQPPYTDLINAYRASNVFVSCSYVEAFSGASTDALACGIPIIIGQKHGVIDVIEEGKTGWVMPYETPSALADLIENLYKQRDLIKTNHNTIKNSIKPLSWDTISNQMAEVYKRII